MNITIGSTIRFKGQKDIWLVISKDSDFMFLMNLARIGDIISTSLGIGTEVPNVEVIFLNDFNEDWFWEFGEYKFLHNTILKNGQICFTINDLKIPEEYEFLAKEFRAKLEHNKKCLILLQVVEHINVVRRLLTASIVNTGIPA